MSKDEELVGISFKMVRLTAHSKYIPGILRTQLISEIAPEPLNLEHRGRKHC
jgi:hypothetical protein